MREIASNTTRHHLHIIDRPCGTGKTTQMLRSFQKGQKYLVVVPLLSEVERVIDQASIYFVQPGEQPSKAAHLEALLSQGHNVVTTHALYKVIADLAPRGLLDDYHIIIDEVLDVVQPVTGPSKTSFREFYLEKGYAIEDADGLVVPTEKWDADFTHVSDTLMASLYHMAKSRTLYRVDECFFLWALPASLLQAGRSITVYTYMAEGSLMVAYLRKKGILFSHERYPKEQSFRTSMKALIDIRGIPSLHDPRKKIRFSYTGQTERQGRETREKAVSQALKKLRERALRGLDLNNVLVTCAKENWFRNGDEASLKPAGFSKGSRMFDAIWLPNTTRGTNAYAHASVCIYLYDQHIHPYLSRWLGLAGCREAHDRYALAELIQWVFRSRIRRGEPVTVYLPSNRMRDLLQEWLEGKETLTTTVPLRTAA